MLLGQNLGSRKSGYQYITQICGNPKNAMPGLHGVGHSNGHLLLPLGCGYENHWDDLLKFGDIQMHDLMPILGIFWGY